MSCTPVKSASFGRCLPRKARRTYMRHCNRLVMLASVLTGILTGMTAFAQESNPTSKPSTPEITQKDGIYLYRVNVVQRDLDAVNYLHRSGSTKIGFVGTPLLPLAKGDAKVESE